MLSIDAVQVISLSKLTSHLIFPFMTLSRPYPMSAVESLFQIQNASGWHPPTDIAVKKSLRVINMTLGLDPHFYTFHSFRRSGATFAFNGHVPIQHIKRHGTLSPECVWHFIQADPLLMTTWGWFHEASFVFSFLKVKEGFP